MARSRPKDGSTLLFSAAVREKTSLQLGAENSGSRPGTKGFLLSLSIWCFLMLTFQLVADLVKGAITFRPGELYLWIPSLPGIVRTSVLGVITVGCVFLLCRKLPTRLRVAFAFLIGLIIPPFLGVSMGFIHETYGYFQGTALEALTAGFVSAVPSAVAASIAAAGMRGGWRRRKAER